jgi:TonB dependent receptor-like, beta-barrel
VANVAGDPSLRVPYAFTDGAARLVLPLGHEARIEMSGLHETDQLRGDVRNIIRSSSGSWGNSTGRITLAAPLGGLTSRTTIGGTRFRGNLAVTSRIPVFSDTGVTFVPTPVPDSSAVSLHSALDNRLDYGLLEQSIEPRGGGASATWRAGVQLIQQSQFYQGPFPRPYPSVIPFDSLRITESRSTAALWGEVRWDLTAGLTLDAGMRGEAELADSSRYVPPFTLSPRIALRYALGQAASVTAGYARTYQQTQAVAPAGAGIGPDLHLTDVWLLAGTNAPPVRSDIWTLGAEAWLGSGWVGGANLYWRRAVGVAVPDPSPGVYTSIRPVFVSGVNRAQGVEVSLRRLAGRLTTSVSLTYGMSRMKAQSSINGALFDYPASADRRAVMDGTASYRLTEQLRIGGAVSVASGAPYTRFILETLPCDSLATSCPPAAGALTIEAPNAERTPTYASFNLMADWHKDFSSWTAGVFVQVRNALNRRNAVTYTGSLGRCQGAPAQSLALEPRAGVCDLFNSGLRLLPLAGVNIAF